MELSSFCPQNDRISTRETSLSFSSGCVDMNIGASANLSRSASKKHPKRYQKERIFGPNDKNEEFLESNSEMNEISKNSS